jgi:hypothetical protein
MLSLSGSKEEDTDSGSHAVAARVVGGGEAAFFDPNYGEFVFPDSANLERFLNEFFDISDYIFKYNGRRLITTYRGEIYYDARV